MANFKPTIKEPMSDQSKEFEKDFKKTMVTTAPDIAPTITMNETDGMLSEVEQSLKKKIFSLAKMEALVFSDPKLSTVYEDMAENGEEKYGYHYNETIQNMIFNDYVLNSPQYLQKYKMAIPKEKKRRDKSGINKLKKAGVEKMAQSGLPKQKEITEGDEEITKVIFLIHPNDTDVFAYFPEEKHDISGKYMTGYVHIGQHTAVDPNYARESREATPEEYQDLKAELEGIGYNLQVLNGLQESSTAGSAGGAAGYVGYAGPAAFSSKGDLSGDFKGKNKKKSIDPKAKPISTGFALHETNYLTDPSGFEKYIDMLNEESDAQYILNKSDAYGSVDNMSPENQNVIKKDIQNRKWDNNSNIRGGIALQEKAKSVAQQQLMGMAYAYKKGELDGEPSAEVKKIADGMSEKDLDDFASTKHKGLPDHVNEVNNFLGIKKLISPIPQGADFREENGQPLLLYYGGNPEAKAWAENVSKRFGIPAHDTNNIKENTNDMEQDNFIQGLHANTDRPNVSIDDRVKLMDYLKNNVITPEQKIEYVTSQLTGEGNHEWVKNLHDEAINDLYFKFWAVEHDVYPDPAYQKEETQTMIQNNGTSMSNKSQATGDMSSDTPMGTQGGGGMNESDMKLLEEINNELEAFSVHHNKLKLMSEDRKTTSQILNKRVTDQNPANFKKDLQNSGVKQTLDVEKELEWKDQQTDVGDDPQKLGQDIEKKAIKTADMKGDEALKNVGNSTNRDGDEIPKRNLTTKEQEEVDLYRNGLHSYNYDNEPSERFVERMKADQGAFFEMGEKQKAFKADAPMYDKDTQPIDDGIEKVQFDKNLKQKGDKVAWNERMGIGSNVKLSESMISGKYNNEIGKSHIVDFNLSDVTLVESAENLFELNFTGLGNRYVAKTVNKKVVVNEGVVNVMESHKFFTNGKEVFAVKNPTQSLNEGEVKEEKPVINEQQEKMKHLLGYKPDSFVNTKNVKQNRGF